MTSATAAITDGVNTSYSHNGDSALATVARSARSWVHFSHSESIVRNLANVAENTAAAQGRSMDTDYAAETANLTKAQILRQAATSVLSQANAQPQAVLTLLPIGAELILQVFCGWVAIKRNHLFCDQLGEVKCHFQSTQISRR